MTDTISEPRQKLAYSIDEISEQTTLSKPFFAKRNSSRTVKGQPLWKQGFSISGKRKEKNNEFIQTLEQ